MTWHERQNDVCFERSISCEVPTKLHRVGKAKSTTNARIFPLLFAVSAGRRMSKRIKPALSTNNATVSASGEIMQSHPRRHTTSVTNGNRIRWQSQRTYLLCPYLLC